MANGKTSSGGSGMGSVHKENIKMKEFMSSLGDAPGKGSMKTHKGISPPRLEELTVPSFEPPRMSGERVMNMLLRSMPREILKMDPPKMPKLPMPPVKAKKKEKVYDLGMLPEATIKSKK